MSTEFFNDQWRIPSNENQNKVSNYSMKFDGTNDVVNFGNNAPFNAASTSFSISLWCKSPNSFAGSENLVESRLSYASPNGIAIEFISNTMNFRKNGSTVAKSIADWGLNNTNWNHIVYAYDLTLSGDKVFVYINGALLSSTPQAATSQPASTGDFKIGDGLRGNFSGSIDQVNIFDYTLSASQVSTLYGGGAAVVNPLSLSPKPVSYYQLGDQSVDNVANYLVPNNSLQDYVFNFTGSNWIDLGVGTLPFNANVTDFSVSCWVKSTQFGVSGSNFVVFSNGFGNAQGGINLGSTGSNVTLTLQQVSGPRLHNIATSNFSTTNWNHILVTVTSGGINADRLKIYVNGNVFNVNMSDSPVKFPELAINQKPFTIGSRNSVIPTVGEFSNFSTFNKTLTAAEAAIVYNNGSPNDISSLSPVGWWKLNAQDTFDGTNWNIKDYGSGSNNGTSAGMTSANLVVSDLQHTSGYSPYALSFADDDSIEIPTNTNLEIAGNITISAWIKSSSSSTGSTKIINKRNASSTNFDFFLDTGGTELKFFDGTDNIASDISITLGVWNHVAITIQSGVTNGSIFYVNGVAQATNLPTFTIASNTAPLVVGASFGRNSAFFNGDISNVSIFNYSLSSTEITEIYNQGVPSNLNTFSGTAPVGWWQLGANSSFNTNWNCLDEIGTSNGVSLNMTNDDIVNGVGYSANGLGTSSIEIVGDSPYSTANGLSNSMDVLDRLKDTPPT